MAGSTENEDKTGCVIYRRTSGWEKVEVPWGHVPCWRCKGAGQMSKYDEGWSSVMHEPSLAALRECFACGGRGYLKEKA